MKNKIFKIIGTLTLLVSLYFLGIFVKDNFIYPHLAPFKKANKLMNKSSGMNELYFEPVFKHINKSISLNDSFDISYALRAWAYHKVKKYDLALKDFNKAIELNSNELSYYYRRANTYQKLNMNDEVLEDYDKAISMIEHEQEGLFVKFLWEKMMFCLKLENDKCVIEEATNLINKDYIHEQSKQFLTTYYGFRGNVYEKNKEYDKALNDYSKAMELETKNPQPQGYCRRGILYFKLGKFNKALEDFNTALSYSKIQGFGTSPYFVRAVANVRLEKTTEALEDLDTSISKVYHNTFYGKKKNKKKAKYHYLRGLINYKLENISKAKEDYKKAIESNSDLSDEKFEYQNQIKNFDKLFNISYGCTLSDRDDKDFYDFIKTQ